MIQQCLKTSGPINPSSCFLPEKISRYLGMARSWYREILVSQVGSPWGSTSAGEGKKRHGGVGGACGDAHRNGEGRSIGVARWGLRGGRACPLLCRGWVGNGVGLRDSV